MAYVLIVGTVKDGGVVGASSVEAGPGLWSGKVYEWGAETW